MIKIIIHVVEKGDSLYSIGNRYGVDYLKIAKDNEIPLDEQLVIGQTIVIVDGRKPKKGIVEINGYAYPNIDKETLDKTLPYLTYLSVFSYEVLADGTFTYINDQHIVDACIANRVMPILVITNIEHNGGFNSDIANAFLSNQKAQDNLIKSLLAVMKEKKYSGVDVDFEYVYPKDKEKYNDFLVKITDAMHNNGFSVSVALPSKISANQKGVLFEAYDYRFIGEIVDFVTLMTYEWGYAYSQPMAVAPIYEVRAVLDYAVTEIPSIDILMGIPNYGYDWIIPFKENTPAKAIQNANAVALARKYGAEIEFNTKSQTPFFRYFDENKLEHEVWFEDARSILSKLELIYEYNLAGASYWNVNTFYAQNWLVLNSLYDVAKA